MLADVVRLPVQQAIQPRSTPRVLLAFDGSAGAWTALERAIDVAVAEHARLTIAGVVGEPTVWTGFAPVALPFTGEMLRKELEREMEQHLAAARDEVPATVSVDVRLLHGKPAAVLSELAEAGGYDLVVAGPRPAGRLRRLLGRSVTHALLTRSSASVLAVKA
jgi:nucleotide-binding universal stress UspA family protein